MSKSPKVFSAVKHALSGPTALHCLHLTVPRDLQTHNLTLGSVHWERGRTCAWGETREETPSANFFLTVVTHALQGMTHQIYIALMTQ